MWKKLKKGIKCIKGQTNKGASKIKPGEWKHPTTRWMPFCWSRSKQDRWQVDTVFTGPQCQNCSRGAFFAFFFPSFLPGRKSHGKTGPRSSRVDVQTSFRRNQAASIVFPQLRPTTLNTSLRLLPTVFGLSSASLSASKRPYVWRAFLSLPLPTLPQSGQEKEMQNQGEDSGWSWVLWFGVVEESWGVFPMWLNTSRVCFVSA